MEMSIADKNPQSLEKKATESESVELQKQKLFEKVLVNKKRTFKLFQAGDKDLNHEA